jgi:hypothetical protein
VYIAHTHPQKPMQSWVHCTNANPSGAQVLNFGGTSSLYRLSINVLYAMLKSQLT